MTDKRKRKSKRRSSRQPVPVKKSWGLSQLLLGLRLISGLNILVECLKFIGDFWPFYRRYYLLRQGKLARSLAL